MGRMELKKKMWEVAHEYARKFGEVIGVDVDHWVGESPEICCYGDLFFFSLDEMRMVVDNLPKYVKKYGSKEAVGQEVKDWVYWWTDNLAGDVADTIMELVMERVTKQLRPNINLAAWLDGCPRHGREAWSGPDADYMRLQNERQTLEMLIADYGKKKRLEEVMRSVDEKLERASREKRERDRKEYELVLGSEAYKHFMNSVKEV